MVAAWCFGRKQQLVWNKCVSLPAELQIMATPEGPFQSAEDILFSSELAGHVLLDGDTSTWSLRLLVECSPAVQLDKMATRDSSQRRVFWNSLASISANLKAASETLKSASSRCRDALRIAHSIFQPHCLGDTTATTTAFTDDQASMSMDDSFDVDCDPFDLGDVDEAAAPFSKGKQRTDKGDEGKHQKKQREGNHISVTSEQKPKQGVTPSNVPITRLYRKETNLVAGVFLLTWKPGKGARAPTWEVHCPFHWGCKKERCRLTTVASKPFAME